MARDGMIILLGVMVIKHSLHFGADSVDGAGGVDTLIIDGNSLTIVLIEARWFLHC